MPREASELMRDGEDLLSTALSLHMSLSGASDPLSEDEELRHVLILKTALAHWHPSIHHRRFDDAVKEVIQAVLAEHAFAVDKMADAVAFTRHLEDADAIIAKWPEWKRQFAVSYATLPEPAAAPRSSSESTPAASPATDPLATSPPSARH